ncbi:MAG: Gfo/Idh/MocA family oxidoreductase [Chloroflexi bacterium]|nr:MAG: Gfo/Idh/MocA family oxidoreductase [Chloroflexota bacterium]
MRVAIVGAGWIAAEHIATLRQLDAVEVVAVCDVNRTRAAELAGQAATYTQWTEMIARERPDGIFVCTPPLTHREVAVAALEQDIHVYLEKPIARGLADARAIVDVAGRSRAVCAVGYQWRAVEVLDDLRAALSGQDLGLLIGISAGPTRSRPWFLDRAQGGGNLLERASHQIDLERAVAGEVVSVQAAASGVLLAQSQGQRGNIDDAAAVLLHFADGGLGAIQIAWTRDGLPGTYSLDVYGSDASLHLELDPAFALHGRSDGRQIEATSRQHPLERSLVRFIAAAREGKRDHVFCSPVDAAATLAVAIACEEALSSGGTVRVPSY